MTKNELLEEISWNCWITYISENFKCDFRKTLISLYIVTNLSSKSHVNFEGGQSACKRFRCRGVWQSCKKKLQTCGVGLTDCHVSKNILLWQTAICYLVHKKHCYEWQFSANYSFSIFFTANVILASVMIEINFL